MHPLPDNMAQRFFTIRKVIMIGSILIVMRLSWNTLKSILREPEPLDVSDIPDPTFDLNFKPRSCVMVNGQCQPMNESDVAFLGKGLYAKGKQFYLDGRPFRIFSGSFHYFRTHPVQWGDRLEKMKAAGLNTVMTYVPWNVHEPVKGQYSFGGRWDLVSFIQQAHTVGLKVIIRPGPYICAEWEYGGLPGWLLQDPHMKVRTSKYKPFLQHVEDYFSKLLSLLAPHTYKRGGPIIAFQVENEFGSYGSHDPEYLEFLEKQHRKWGIQELLFTSDGFNFLANGTLPHILASVNFNKEPARRLRALAKFQPNRPLLVTEFWSGWFDHWGEKHHLLQNQVFQKLVDAVLHMNASINFYMFVGGTNFGMMSGANLMKNKYLPTVTSYDYDAPVSECGDITPKFHIVRKLLQQYSLYPLDLPPVPPNAPKAAYGMVAVQDWLSYDDLVRALTQVHAESLSQLVHTNPHVMETLTTVGGAQTVGWLLYRTHVQHGAKLRIPGRMEDRAQVILNGQQVALLSPHNRSAVVNINIKSNKVLNTLDILVENMGRINFKERLDKQRKGIMGQVEIDGRPVTNWTHIPLTLTDAVINTLLSVSSWQKYTSPPATQAPGMYRAYLDITDKPKDTFIDMRKWTKGVVFVNGFCLGRYWNIGPQQTLYVPAPALAPGTNTLVVLELHRPHTTINSVDKPQLGQTTQYMKVHL